MFCKPSYTQYKKALHSVHPTILQDRCLHVLLLPFGNQTFSHPTEHVAMSETLLDFTRVWQILSELCVELFLSMISSSTASMRTLARPYLKLNAYCPRVQLQRNSLCIELYAKAVHIQMEDGSRTVLNPTQDSQSLKPWTSHSVCKRTPNRKRYQNLSTCILNPMFIVCHPTCRIQQTF